MLTIFISCFNVGSRSIQGGGSFIEDCLKSLDFDGPIILTDDGSEDDTLSYLDRGTVIHHEMNEGLRDSWREAIELCQTKYLLRVDADIRFPRADWNLALVQHMELHPECSAVGLTQIVGGRLHSAGDVFKDKYQHVREPIAGDYRVCPSVMGCFVCHRMSVLRSMGLNANKWIRCETEDLHLRMWEEGHQVHCLPLTFQHRHNECIPKRGTYNSSAQAEWISSHMWDRHKVDWLGNRGGTKLTRLQRYNDV